MLTNNLAVTFKSLAAAPLILVLVMTEAFASIQAVGDPYETNSWAQGWNESGVGPFDMIASQVVSIGDTFESPVFYSFSSGSWADQVAEAGPFPTLGVASGSAVSSLNFSMTYAGSPYDGIQIDLLAFNGLTLVDSVRATYSGGWSYAATPWSPSRADLEQVIAANAGVPEPGSLIVWSTLGLALGGAVLRRRRRRAVA